jgi:hypothetical protein
MQSAVTHDFAGPRYFDLEVRIDLSFFSEEEPTFAFRTDDGHIPIPGPGLQIVGKSMIDHDEFHLLKVLSRPAEGHVSFQFPAAGEYRVEIYVIRPNTKPKLIFEECFACK